MHVVQKRVRSNKKMYSPTQRGLVRTDLGLGSVDGLFNIGKMFSRLTHFTSSSFKISNIMGALGSFTSGVLTGGLAPALLPKITGAHSALMKDLGMGTLAVAAVAGGAALLPAGALTMGGGAAAVGTETVGTVGTEAAGSSVIGAVTGQTAAEGGILSTVGSGISAVGSGLMNVVKALPFVSTMLSHGSGTAVQVDTSGGQYPPGYAPVGYQVAQPVAAPQMYTPGYNPSIPFVAGQYPGSPTMDNAYGDLRSPYTAIAEDGSTVQVDPVTGQVISAGMSIGMMTMLGGVVLLAGWYFMSDNSKQTH